MEKEKLIEKLESMTHATRIPKDSEIGKAIHEHGCYDHDCSNWSCFSDNHTNRQYSSQPVFIDDLIVYSVRDQFGDDIDEYFEI